MPWAAKESMPICHAMEANAAILQQFADDPQPFDRTDCVLKLLPVEGCMMSAWWVHGLSIVRDEVAWQQHATHGAAPAIFRLFKVMEIRALDDHAPDKLTVSLWRQRLCMYTIHINTPYVYKTLYTHMLLLTTSVMALQLCRRQLTERYWH